jgi:hypothetical protein
MGNAKDPRNLLPIDAEIEDVLLETISPKEHDRVFTYACGNCYSSKRGLGALRCSDGRVQVRAYCQRCGSRLSDVLKLPKGLASHVPIAEEAWRHYPCSVKGCQEEYSQEHHVMPQSIDFKLAYTYPTVFLCERHHRLWHDKTGIATGRS